MLVADARIAITRSNGPTMVAAFTTDVPAHASCALFPSYVRVSGMSRILRTFCTTRSQRTA
jgi:hypothetical protein